MSPGPRQPPAYWFSDQPPPILSRLLSGLYAAVIALRGALYQRGLLRRVRVTAPVIVVGNLIAGGSGKTPLVIALVERLRTTGTLPLSRGRLRDRSRCGAGSVCAVATVGLDGRAPSRKIGIPYGEHEETCRRLCVAD